MSDRRMTMVPVAARARSCAFHQIDIGSQKAAVDEPIQRSLKTIVFHLQIRKNTAYDEDQLRMLPPRHHGFQYRRIAFSILMTFLKRPVGENAYLCLRQIAAAHAHGAGKADAEMVHDAADSLIYNEKLHLVGLFRWD